ncbi:MAG TPA: ParB N-terminal domain-containing protein, partial [Planctomycetaceae bacterium]|nr:ParB N-terminal domain-containing protein [Planctomycetaceae bacterium]
MPDPAPALKSDFIDPKKLTNHPLNAQLYGTKPDAEFVSSVRRLGVLEPVEITQSGIIISGHRRRQAAIIAELEAVPVRVHTDELTDLEIRQRIIEANRQRKKTTEEIAREYSELVRVEKELAKQRQQEHGSTAPGRKNTSGDITGSVAAAGEAKEKAAAKAGMGRQKAERAAAVVEEIDKAEAAGDAGRAAELRHELNEGTVAEAHRNARGGASLTAEEQAVYRRLKKTNPDIATRFAGREIDIAEAERLASAAVNQQEKG